MSINESRNKKNAALEAALQYADKGWHVLPVHSFNNGCCTCGKANCNSPAKHPLTMNGVHDATTDADTIKGWWLQHENANVAIATGSQSGLVVIDIDAKSGGHESLRELQAEHGSLPSTPTVRTGGDGTHFLFAYPQDHVVGNRSGVVPGIDVRGDNGYVVAAASLHASGKPYAWEIGHYTKLAELPPWLLKLITSPKDAAASGGMTLAVESPAIDLGTHPGEGEGKRNATLCRLVGIHLARGEAACDVEELALAWGERCTPPLAANEITPVVKSLARKHERTPSIVVPVSHEQDIDQLPLPEPPVWPTLEDAALHGIVGEIVGKIEPHTEADPVAVLVSLLVAFGNIVGRKPHFHVEGDRHHANLFTVLVGDSSRGRKGTSLGRTLSLLEPADADWHRDCITCGLSSGEGLIWSVRDRLEGMEPVKEKGQITGYQQVVRDHGVMDKRLFVVESEFAQALRVMRREGNTLSPVIRQAWDSGKLKTMTKNNNAVATDTHVSILGHITRPELNEYLGNTDVFNGFANRFLWCLVRRSKLLPDGGRALDLEPLQTRLAGAVQSARKIGKMSRSADASDLWHTVYPTLTAEKPGLYGATTGRGEAQTLRLSMLYALLDGAAIIDTAHLQAAQAVWNYCDASAKTIFHVEDGTENVLEASLLETIRCQPGVSRRGLHKSLGGRMPATEIVKALAALRDRKLIRCEMEATGGRPAEVWFPCDAQVQVPVVPAPVVESPIAEANGKPVTVEHEATGQNGQPHDDAHLCSFVRNLSVAELFQQVNRLGGRFVRHGEQVTVEANGTAIPVAVTSAIQEHQPVLSDLVPAKADDNPAPAESDDDADVSRALTDEEFMDFFK